jgi:hypothetical protein
MAEGRATGKDERGQAGTSRTGQNQTVSVDRTDHYPGPRGHDVTAALTCLLPLVSLAYTMLGNTMGQL